MAYSGNNFDIKNKIYEVLRSNPDKRMIAREIAQEIEKRYPADCEKKRSNASVDFLEYTFQSQLVSEIVSGRKLLVKKYPELKTVETRPREYYYSSVSEEVELKQTVLNKNNSNKQLSEHDLYPLLGSYLNDSLDTLSMRIDERRSSNSRGSGGNRWLYPDIVGINDLTKSWSVATIEAAKSAGAERASLLSFEVKLKINRSNIRESLFQTVSNSSWANFPYLVASEISEDAMTELRLLSSAHGIGFILLNSDEPKESQILIPSKEREQVDWSLLNRLAVENSDAEKYLKLIRNFYLTGETTTSNWDLTRGNKSRM